jgi:hypothetical protein
MVHAENQWSARATRGPALTVLALASLASFGHGLLGRGDILLSPPQREPMVEARLVVLPPPAVETASLLPRPAAPRRVVAAAREKAPEPAVLAEATRGVAEEGQTLAAAPEAPVLTAEAAAAPAAADQAVPAAEVAPALVEPPDEPQT